MLSIVLVGSSRTRLVAGARRRASTRRAAISTSRGRVTVHFIGAGPGAPDLITVRGLRLIERCPVCLYAGSLVPRAVVDAAPPGARIVDTAPLTLDQIIDEIAAAHARGWMSRACIPAIRRSTARSPSRCAGSTRSASRST